MSFVPVGIPGSLIINAQAGSDKPGLKVRATAEHACTPLHASNYI